MKLVRYGSVGQECPGLVDDEGVLRDLSAVLDDITPDHLSPDAISRIRNFAAADLPAITSSPRFGQPVSGVRQIFGIGLNYRAHAEEAGLPIPTEPIYFMKAVSSLSGPNDPIVMPRGAQQVDWEIELGVVIGSICSYVREANAMDHVAGYVLANDVSERDFQLQRGPQWTKGKSCPTFGPIGPWLVTRDEIDDPYGLDLTLSLNGEVQQSATTADLIFSIPELIASLSRYVTLLPGDVILTGTPSGVGFGQSPQRFLKPGDKMALEITGLGRQGQMSVAASG